MVINLDNFDYLSANFFTQMHEFEQHLVRLLDDINEPLGLALVALLALSGVWFTIRTRGVQFRMIGEAFRMLFRNDSADGTRKHISSFQAFNISLASRIGTGNLAGVATAIAIGGPGAIFWMWVMALIGAANAFVESTLAQLFKVRGKDSFVGGPSYYIAKGMRCRWFAVIFAVAMIFDFGLMNNIVQSNTIALAVESALGVDGLPVPLLITALTLAVIFGGVQRIARISSVIVPFMALLYLVVTVIVLIMRFDSIPDVLMLIVRNAFGAGPAVGGSVGTAIIYGFKRGLFSNEAGEGSAPQAAATAAVSHPVKQGLIQALGVFTDTIVVCSCTAFIILCSGMYTSEANGIELTQLALTNEIGPIGSTLIAVLIFFFAFSSIIGNYYYGESNLYFLTRSRHVMLAFRLVLGGLVFVGATATLDLAWGLVDFFMAVTALCNLTALLLLGRYAVRCLDDYVAQRKAGRNPVYRSSTIPEIADVTECWDDENRQNR